MRLYERIQKMKTVVTFITIFFLLLLLSVGMWAAKVPCGVVPSRVSGCAGERRDLLVVVSPGDGQAQLVPVVRPLRRGRAGQLLGRSQQL